MGSRSRNFKGLAPFPRLFRELPRVPPLGLILIRNLLRRRRNPYWRGAGVNLRGGVAPRGPNPWRAVPSPVRFSKPGPVG
jgi:hypothetical protein